jgi:drug/metabolite transporter (DMT)-like permease
MLSGLALALAAAVCFECSYVLQALAVREVPAMKRPGAGALRGLAGRPRWAFGILLGLAGFALQVLALRHAPLTLVQPVLASGLLLLLAFSVLVLHERVGRRELAAVVAIMAGVGAIALVQPARGHTTNELAFAVAAVALGAVAVSAFVRRTPGLGVLLGSAIAADALAVLAAAQAARNLPDILPSAAWGVLAGACGLATLASESAALQRNGASHVAPIVLAGQVAVPVALAPLLLDEGWGTTTAGLVALLGGLLTVVVASAALAASPGVSRLAAGRGEGQDEVGGIG